MNLRYGLTEDDIQKLCGVFERHPQIRKVILYGSRAKGNFKPGSDIDITLKAQLDGLTFSQIQTELDDLLLPYQIDISLYDQLVNPALRSHVDRIGQVLFERQ